MTADTVQSEPRPQPDRAARLPTMRVSSYDRVAGLLVALLILVGGVVLLLFLQWLTMRVLSGLGTAPPVELEQFGDGTDGAMGGDEEFSEPGLEELDEMLEPALEDTLAAVTDVPSSEAASLDAVQGTAERAGHGTGERRRPGTGEGIGGALPPWERWEVHYGDSGLGEYARRLDFFGIELAALGGGDPTVYYAAKLAQDKPRKRTAKGGADEKRLCMTWLDPRKQAADRQLLKKAGVDTTGRYVTQFYPDMLYKALLRLEKAQSGGRKTSEIQKTVFRVRPDGSGYRFYVGQQEYRNTP